MECCGEPFGIGSTIEWVLRPVTDSRRKFFRSVFGDDAAARITDTEEGHSGDAPEDGDLPVVTGIVRSIERVAWVLQPRPEDLPMSMEPDVYAVPGSLVIEARSTAEVREDGETHPPRHGWLVNLDVRDATEANA